MIKAIQNNINNGNNVIPMPTSSKRNKTTSFKAESPTTDSFIKTQAKKEPSVLDGLSELGGFLGGMIIGDRVGRKLITSKLKNKTFVKEVAILVPIEIVIGLAGQKLARTIANKEN